MRSFALEPARLATTPAVGVSRVGRSLFQCFGSLPRIVNAACLRWFIQFARCHAQGVLKQRASAVSISLPEQCGCSCKQPLFTREEEGTGVAVDRSVSMATFGTKSEAASRAADSASGRSNSETDYGREVKAAALLEICSAERPCPSIALE
jgi:hypothetical protein